MLSGLIWVVILVIVLYLARIYAHQIIRSLSHVIHNAMRVAARSLNLAEERLSRRNREVLLAAGADAAERKIEREFERINAVVTRDLQGYPAMHRAMSDLITAIDEDYRVSTDSPPSPPAWIDAVEAVAKIPSPGDNMVANMLLQINRTIEKHHKQSLDEYRKSSKTRHGLLEKMMPYWRKTSSTLDRVDKTIKGLVQRSSHIDEQMKGYKDIIAGTDRAERMLSSSSLTQFAISTVVLLIAIGGAMVNFNLIALPMSEMVGGGTYIGGFKMANVAALVIILVETALGIYLMESLRITRLFPIIGNMNDKKRRGFMWAALIFLFTLACVESSLAFMRDIIATDRQALIQSLADVEGVASPATQWIPMVGQMVMGFILPFALAFVAIPFESFVHSSRTVLGVVVMGLLRFMAFLLRLIGNVALYSGNMLIHLYDLLAFPLLGVERLVRSAGKHAKEGAKEGS
jgi:hypothetical protein